MALYRETDWGGRILALNPRGTITRILVDRGEAQCLFETGEHEDLHMIIECSTEHADVLWSILEEFGSWGGGLLVNGWIQAFAMGYLTTRWPDDQHGAKEFDDPRLIYRYHQGVEYAMRTMDHGVKK